MPGSPALTVFESGKGYTENEEIFIVNGRQYHFIVTVKPVMSGEETEGLVISFRDIEEAQKLVYSFSNRTVKNTVDDIIGTSKSIMAAKRNTLKFAKGNSTVLITGESERAKRCLPRLSTTPAPEPANLL